MRSCNFSKASGKLFGFCKSPKLCDRILTQSRKKASGQKSCLSPNSTYRSRFETLNGRYVKASQQKPGSAAWWRYLWPVLVLEEETGKAIDLKLSCLLCDSTFSASNESRIDGTHLNGGACSAWKHNDDLAHEIALAFLTPAEQPHAAADKTNETGHLDEPAEKKRKVQSTVFDFAVTKEQEAQIKQCIGNWFMEASDAMAPHAIEHPRANELFKRLGCQPVTRQVTISAYLVFAHCLHILVMCMHTTSLQCLHVFLWLWGAQWHEEPWHQRLPRTNCQYTS